MILNSEYSICVYLISDTDGAGAVDDRGDGGDGAPGAAQHRVLSEVLRDGRRDEAVRPVHQRAGHQQQEDRQLDREAAPPQVRQHLREQAAVLRQQPSARNLTRALATSLSTVSNFNKVQFTRCLSSSHLTKFSEIVPRGKQREALPNMKCRVFDSSQQSGR